MTVQSQHDPVDVSKESLESTLSVSDYMRSLQVGLFVGARFGHCYENAYPAFFAFPQLFEPQGHMVEGWIVFVDQSNVVLMEHGWLRSGEHLIDPTIVFAIDPGEPVYYFPGVLRARAELEALETEFFPHVRFSDYGDDGMSHPEYRAAYEAAQQKATSLLTEGKTFVEVKARGLTKEEEEATKRKGPEMRILMLSSDQEGSRYGE